jgi:hypothetical protein
MIACVEPPRLELDLAFSNLHDIYLGLTHYYCGRANEPDSLG